MIYYYLYFYTSFYFHLRKNASFIFALTYMTPRYNNEYITVRHLLVFRNKKSI